MAGLAASFTREVLTLDGLVLRDPCDGGLVCKRRLRAHDLTAGNEAPPIVAG